MEIKENVYKLVSSLEHRGPDDRGNIIYDSFGMGMTRLSIIDLSGGHQPIVDESNRYSIVFNGEIYNYKTLRKKLMNEGAEFKTHSDTEVIIMGYIKKGNSILESLEGMFSFAIYDNENHELFLARDRLGKKPLYYYHDNEKIIFSSEVQALMKIQGLNMSINNQAYWDYLTFRYIPGDCTIVNNIKKLPPGHFSEITARGMTISKFWDFPFTSNNRENLTQTNLVNNFGKLFSRSVEKRLVADVPVGVVLSGGIDSCAILYEASKYKPITSYHVNFREKQGDYNESDYAKLMAKFSGSRLLTVEITEDQFIHTLTEMSGITDEPLSDLASIPFKYVCDLAVKDVKVVLSGEGSDETLAGYGFHGIYKRMIAAKLIQCNSILNKLAVKAGKALFPNLTESLNYLAVPMSQWGDKFNFNITFQIDQSSKLSLKNNCFKDPLDSSRFLKNIYKFAKGEDFLNQTLHIIARDWLVENVLMKSDKVSMSSSLEMRCPFLDHALVEFLFKIPGKCKVGFLNSKFTDKILLRKYLYNNIPREIIERKKMGFPVPAYTLKSPKYREYIFDTLNASNCYYHRLFDRNKILELFQLALEQPLEEKSKLKQFLWSIVVFEQWFQHRSQYLSN